MTETIKKPVTNAEFAYATIKNWILTGQCPPGQHINQDEFAEKMGVSRVPVKSALDKLAGEGLVLIQPHKGAMITPISPDNLINVFTMRFYLESIAVLEAVEKSSEKEAGGLRSLLDGQDHQSDNIEIMLSQNRDFHFAIFHLSKNDVLIKILESLWEQSDRYRRIYFSKPNYQKRITKDLYEIVELFRAGKKQEVADKIAAHTWASLEILLKDIFNETISPPNHKIQSLGHL